MPIIPRYQARGGPRVQTLDYAGAFQPPGGEDWRMLSRVTAATGAMLESLPRRPEPATPVAGAPVVTRGRADPEHQLLGRVGEVRWRRRQLEAESQAMDAEAVALSRQAAARALPDGARAVFDLLTAPREAGFAAAAAARAEAQVREATQALSRERQKVGLEEYQALIDTAPEQALAALGSASSELAARLRESGAPEPEIQDAQRALVSEAQAKRIALVLAADPAQAAAMLAEQAALLAPLTRAELERAVEEERVRLAARMAIADLGARTSDPLAAPEAFIAEAERMAAEDPIQREAYRDAAAGRLRTLASRRDAAEARGWAALEPYLGPEGGAESWTDIPGPVWLDLQPHQKATAKAMLAPWREPGGDPYAELRVRTAGAVAQPGGSAPGYGLGQPLPPLSRQTKALHFYLSDPDSRWRVDPESGHFFRYDREGRSGSGIIYATLDEAQKEVERRLGIKSQRPGVRSGAELELRSKQFGYMSDRAGADWPKLNLPMAVDWDFVGTEESGSPETRVSVYFPTGKSGPTIAHGLDIGVRNARDLANLKLPPDLVRKLTPYLGKTGAAAKSYVAAHPLTLSRAEADQIDQAARNYEMGNLIPAFDAASKVGPFRNLPADAQTAIASLYYNLGTSKVPGWPKDFWAQIIEGDWEAAAQNLSSGKWENPKRRNREGALMRGAIGATDPYELLWGVKLDKP